MQKIDQLREETEVDTRKITYAALGILVSHESVPLRELEDVTVNRCKINPFNADWLRPAA